MALIPRAISSPPRPLDGCLVCRIDNRRTRGTCDLASYCSYPAVLAALKDVPLFRKLKTQRPSSPPAWSTLGCPARSPGARLRRGQHSRIQPVPAPGGNGQDGRAVRCARLSRRRSPQVSSTPCGRIGRVRRQGRLAASIYCAWGWSSRRSRIDHLPLRSADRCRQAGAEPDVASSPHELCRENRRRKTILDVASPIRASPLSSAPGADNSDAW